MRQAPHVTARGLALGVLGHQAVRSSVLRTVFMFAANTRSHLTQAQQSHRYKLWEGAHIAHAHVHAHVHVTHMHIRMRRLARSLIAGTNAVAHLAARHA